MNKKSTLLFFSLLIFVFGCSTNIVKSTEELITREEIHLGEPYPLLENTPYPLLENTPYPLLENTPFTTSEVPYPSVTKTEKYQDIDMPLFEIFEPVIGGSIEVKGKGPANVPIILIDVTEMGIELGKTTIDKNGNFLFNLEKPLIENNSIGLKVGDLSGTEYNYDDFLFNDNYFDRPFIGLVLDIVPVIQP
jgi:hypothetical protein